MLNVLIVEDELRPARALQRLLQEARPEAQVVAHLESVADTVAWLTKHPAPDLLFMDIHLADGSNFEIFRRVEITCPVIFITAYDEHALEAFQVHSIHPPGRAGASAATPAAAGSPETPRRAR